MRPGLKRFLLDPPLRVFVPAMFFLMWLLLALTTDFGVGGSAISSAVIRTGVLIAAFAPSCLSADITMLRRRLA